MHMAKRRKKTGKKKAAKKGSKKRARKGSKPKKKALTMNELYRVRAQALVNRPKNKRALKAYKEVFSEEGVM
jgi:hypothetical protein